MPGGHLVLRKLADKSGSPNDDGSWPFAGLALEIDPPREHQFSDSFVDEAITGGYGSLGDGLFTLHTVTGDLVYRIVESPGPYDEPDLDKEPSGKRVSHAYACELVSAPGGAPDDISELDEK